MAHSTEHHHDRRHGPRLVVSQDVVSDPRELPVKGRPVKPVPSAPDPRLPLGADNTSDGNQ